MIVTMLVVRMIDDDDHLFRYHMSSHMGSFTSDHGWKYYD